MFFLNFAFANCQLLTVEDPGMPWANYSFRVGTATFGGGFFFGRANCQLLIVEDPGVPWANCCFSMACPL